MRAVLFAAVSLVVACDPGFLIEGTVVDATGKPVPNARVSFVCYGVVQETVSSDEKGAFRDDRIGVFGDECTITIGVAGQIEAFPIMKYCAKRSHGNQCSVVRVHATLH